MKDEDKIAGLKILAFPTIFAGLLILFLPLALLNAWVVQKMYGWFLLPLGAPELNLWHIWGMSMLVAYYIDRSNDDGKVLKRLGMRLLGMFIMLGVGFFIKSHI